MTTIRVVDDKLLGEHLAVDTADTEVLEFIKYAVKKHEDLGQKYGEEGYQYHLINVAAVVQKFEDLMTEQEFRLAMMGAFGHDLIEDTHETYNDIKKVSSEALAEVIYACTEEKGRNRAERHNERFYECLTANKIGLLVKLADVIANTNHSKVTGHRMYKTYQKEWPAMREKVFAAAKEYGIEDMVYLMDEFVA